MTVVLLLAPAAAMAQGPAAPPESPEGSTPAESGENKRSLDRLSLPPEALVVLCDDLRIALQAMQPNAVVLSADQYQALMARIARLEKPPPGPERPPLLSTCRISGQLAGEGLGLSAARIELRIELEFRTTTANAVVPVGFKGAALTQASLDGDIPVWGPDRDGLSVIVSEPRVHQLVLQMLVPVTRPGKEWRLLLEQLPPAAITTLDLRVPGTVRNASVVGVGAIATEPVDAGRTLIRSEALGTIDQLDLRWQPAGTARPTAAILAVISDLRVTVDESGTETEARVRLEARQGSVASLRFRVPSDVAALKVDDDVRTDVAGWSFASNGSVLTIQLRNPLAAAGPAQELLVRWRQNLAAKLTTPVNIGHLELLDHKDSIQNGTIAVAGSGEQRSRLQPQNVFRVDPRAISLPDFRPTLGVYRYWQQPARLQLLLDASPVVQPLVEVRVNHRLHITGSSALLGSEFEVIPKGRTAVQELDVRWPKGFVLDRRSILPVLIDQITILEGEEGTIARVSLSSRQQSRFAFRLDGLLTDHAQPMDPIPLPCVLQAGVAREDKRESAMIVHGKSELRLEVEGAQVELLPSCQGLVGELNRDPEYYRPLGGTSVFSLATPSLDRPWSLALDWRPQRTRVQIEARAFVTNRQFEFVQSLRYQFAGVPPAQLWLRVPSSIADSVNWSIAMDADAGQTQELIGITGDRSRTQEGEYIERPLALPRTTGTSCTITARYQRSMPPNGLPTTLTLPLIVPSSDAVVSERVHVGLWTSRALSADLAGDSLGWQTTSNGAFRGSSCAPTLNLTGTDLKAPPVISLSAIPRTGVPELFAERLLIEVRLTHPDVLHYRTRVRCTSIGDDEVVMALPGGTRSLVVQSVRLNGEELPLGGLRLEPSLEDPSCTILRVPLPAAYLAESPLLDIQFQTARKAAPWFAIADKVPVPAFAAGAALGVVRWSIEIPEGQLLVAEAPRLAPEQSWTWNMWLCPPQPVRDSRILDEWIGLAQVDAPGSHVAATYRFQGDGTAGPLLVVRVPNTLTLLIPSLAVLLGGILCYAHPPRRPWLMLGLFLGANVSLAMFVPQFWMAAIYGAQPGMVVLGLLLGALWLRQRRWRRQVVLLPGFTRLRAGSSLVRSTAIRPSREPSGNKIEPAPTSPPTTEIPA